MTEREKLPPARPPERKDDDRRIIKEDRDRGNQQGNYTPETDQQPGSPPRPKRD